MVANIKMHIKNDVVSPQTCFEAIEYVIQAIDDVPFQKSAISQDSTHYFRERGYCTGTVVR
jgi:hypothetical protein